MPKIKELYYNATQGRIHYTDKITNRLDANRAMRGLKPWILPTVREIKPKKLILADWTSHHWSIAYKKKVKALLTQLMDEGFNLYTNEKKQIKPLLKKDLIGLGIFKKLNPHHPDELVQRDKKS